MRVAGGIYQVQLPLPFPLRIVNCYVLEDGAGWTVVDAGLNYGAGQAAWLAALAEIGIGPESITRIILTHAHPDHYGMAGWLAAQSGAPVLLSPPEQEFVQRVWRGGPATYEAVATFFRGHGMPDDLTELVYANMGALRPMTEPHPELRLLEPGGPLRVGPREFQVLMAPGHSDGHLVFYCAEERLLLCGDAVLTKITPNISLWPHGRPDPLADFLQSLDVLDTLDVELALPGHGPNIQAFRQRLQELREHHAARLQAMEHAARHGATAFTICTSVFPTGELSPHQIRFAMAETLAHLEYLVGIGRLARVKQDKVLYQQVNIENRR